jgi:hypothetical protein
MYGDDCIVWWILIKNESLSTNIELLDWCIDVYFNKPVIH